MQKALRIKTLVYALLFCAASMAAMLFYADRKAITIANVAQDQVSQEKVNTFENQTGSQKEQLLRFRQGEDNTDYLCIPLEAGVTAEDVTMENHYVERQMWIYLKGVSADYYGTEAVFGNIFGIEAGSFEVLEETVLLKFQLDGVYECQSVLEENHLYIEFVPPKEVYDKIVVIDAGCGGSDWGCQTEELKEKEVTLDVVKKLKALLDGTDIKVYYTRTEDKELSAEQRVELANGVKADLFISVHLNESDDAAVYGTESFYNANYFIPGLDSADLADIVERSVVTSISGKGNGLYPAGDSDIMLEKATVPVTLVRLGYVSNRQEALLLQREDYRERIAKGLYEAILEAYQSEENNG